MNAVLRALPLALGLTSAALGLDAEAPSDGLPPIFSGEAPHVQRRTSLPAPAIVRPPAPMSGRVREHLTERVAASAAAWPVAAPPAKRTWWVAALDSTDAIVMDRYVVVEPLEKKTEVERTPNVLYHMFSTGHLHTFGDGKGPDLMWGLSPVRAPAIGTMSTAPRLELSLKWRW